MVYVDDMQATLGRMVMCHMFADTVLELHEMACRIGIRRQWFQDKSAPHYDVCKSKRSLAVEAGAEEIKYGGEKWKEVYRRIRDKRRPASHSQRETIQLTT